MVRAISLKSTIPWCPVIFSSSRSTLSRWFFAHFNLLLRLLKLTLEIHDFHLKLVIKLVLLGNLFLISLVLHLKLLIGVLLLSKKSLQAFNGRFLTFFTMTMKWVVVHFRNSTKLRMSLGISDSLGYRLATLADDWIVKDLHNVVHFRSFHLAWSRCCLKGWVMRFKFVQETWVLFDFPVFRRRNREYIFLCFI